MCKRFLLAALLLAACGPIKPNPDPNPTPTPTPLPTPTPTPPPFTCLPPSRIDLAYRPPAGGSRPIVDATPKVVGCDACVAIGFPQGTCVCPLGFEGTPQREECEKKAGPYNWSCFPGRQCFTNNGNPLQVVLCQVTTDPPCAPGPLQSGAVVSVTAANGALGSLTLP